MRTAFTAAIAAAMVCGSGCEAVALAAERVVVRLYESTSVTGDEMRMARSFAGAILREAGVEVAWRDCSDGCAEPLASRDVVMRFVLAPEAAAPGSLGYSVVDSRQRTGTLATVFVDRIRMSALRTRLDPAKLLGRAMAHEIGHLLLGTSDHSRAGLMRARWSDRDLRRDAAADWILSSEDVARLSNRSPSTEPDSAGASN